MPRLTMPPPGTAAGIEADELSLASQEPVHVTIMGTIFIPLTFLAGVYGMNMPIPENRWAGSYFVFWAVCIAIAGGMLLWFRRRGWL